MNIQQSINGNTMPGAHAIYSMSSSDRWAVEGGCTASAEAIAALPPQEEGDEANEGTDAHAEIDRCLRGLNGIPMVGGGDFIAHTEQPNPAHPAAYGIALFINYAYQLVTNSPGRVWVEQRVRLTDKIWGTLDFAHYEETSQVLTVADYKNGYVPVDADSNQFRNYAAAAILTFGLRVKWIRYACVQPNDWRPVPRVKQHVESAESLYAWASRVAAIPDGPKSFRSGEHCRYCPLFGKCEPTRDILKQLADMITLSPGQVRPDQVVPFLATRKCIDDWFKSLEKAQTKEALAGRLPPGMTLIETQKHRAWLDEKAARAAVLEKAGVDGLDLPTPAQAEKLGVDVSKLANKPEGGPALAFESDTRPRWKRKSAAEMFAGLALAGGAK